MNCRPREAWVQCQLYTDYTPGVRCFICPNSESESNCMFDACLDQIKHHVFLHLAIVCFISEFVFIQWIRPLLLWSKTPPLDNIFSRGLQQTTNFQLRNNLSTLLGTVKGLIGA